MKITIRESVIEDIDLIVKYENEYFHNFTTISKVEDEINNPLIHIYILVSKDVLGYINLWVDEDKAQINSLVILKEFRNKGYGNKFLYFIFKKLDELGVKEITLEVRPSNLAAMKLYEKCGFSQVAVRKNYYNNGEDALLMYKRLGSD
ncbi:MAG: ribosomal protein S18-alanine N-acetyltransferase [Candidatus Izemoplasmatales bacterium]|nr:ribosomal protein S18-alanine N-acetyltransferase [Candidatus Izemoplasmatales bacterium]